MTRYGITLGYEKDKCDICEFKREIKIIYDKEEFLVAKICDSCVDSNHSLTAEQVIKKYGTKTTKKDIEILSKEKMEKSGFELKGKKD